MGEADSEIRKLGRRTDEEVLEKYHFFEVSASENALWPEENACGRRRTTIVQCHKH
jgi:hypothetical protein